MPRHALLRRGADSDHGVLRHVRQPASGDAQHHEGREGGRARDQLARAAAA